MAHQHASTARTRAALLRLACAPPLPAAPLQALLALGGLIGFLTKGSTASLGALGSRRACRCPCLALQARRRWPWPQWPLWPWSLSPLLSGALTACVPCTPAPAGGGVGSAAVLAVCSYASLQAYHRGQLCRPATLVSLGEAASAVPGGGWKLLRLPLHSACQHPAAPAAAYHTPAATALAACSLSHCTPAPVAPPHAAAPRLLPHPCSRERGPGLCDVAALRPHRQADAGGAGGVPQVREQGGWPLRCGSRAGGAAGNWVLAVALAKAGGQLRRSSQLLLPPAARTHACAAPPTVLPPGCPLPAARPWQPSTSGTCCCSSPTLRQRQSAREGGRGRGAAALRRRPPL